MELSKSVKLFVIIGLTLFLLGLLLFKSQTGEFAGVLVMISGISLIGGSLFMLISSWLDLKI